MGIDGDGKLDPDELSTFLRSFLLMLLCLRDNLSARTLSCWRETIKDTTDHLSRTIFTFVNVEQDTDIYSVQTNLDQMENIISSLPFDEFGRWYNNHGSEYIQWLELLDLRKWPLTLYGKLMQLGRSLSEPVINLTEESKVGENEEVDSEQETKELVRLQQEIDELKKNLKIPVRERLNVDNNKNLPVTKCIQNHPQKPLTTNLTISLTATDKLKVIQTNIREMKMFLLATNFYQLGVQRLFQSLLLASDSEWKMNKLQAIEWLAMVTHWSKESVAPPIPDANDSCSADNSSCPDNENTDPNLSNSSLAGLGDPGKKKSTIKGKQDKSYKIPSALEQNFEAIVQTVEAVRESEMIIDVRHLLACLCCMLVGNKNEKLSFLHKLFVQKKLLRVPLAGKKYVTAAEDPLSQMLASALSGLIFFCGLPGQSKAQDVKSIVFRTMKELNSSSFSSLKSGDFTEFVNWYEERGSKLMPWVEYLEWKEWGIIISTEKVSSEPVEQEELSFKEKPDAGSCEQVGVFSEKEVVYKFTLSEDLGVTLNVCVSDVRRLGSLVALSGLRQYTVSEILEQLQKRSECGKLKFQSYHEIIGQFMFNTDDYDKTFSKYSHLLALIFLTSM